jgi:hypothetical protein
MMVISHEEAVSKCQELLDRANKLRDGGADLASIQLYLTEAQVYATLALSLRPHW